MNARRYRLSTDASTHRVELPLVVPGASRDGPDRLSGALIDRLIEAERAGAHTVLLATTRADLDADPAIVCRYVVTDDDDVARAARGRFGPEWVLQVPSTAVTRIDEWVHRLPKPEAHTLRRRIRRAARSVPLIRAAYDRIRPEQ